MASETQAQWRRLLRRGGCFGAFALCVARPALASELLLALRCSCCSASSSSSSSSISCSASALSSSSSSAKWHREPAGWCNAADQAEQGATDAQHPPFSHPRHRYRRGQPPLPPPPAAPTEHAAAWATETWGGGRGASRGGSRHAAMPHGPAGSRSAAGPRSDMQASGPYARSKTCCQPPASDHRSGAPHLSLFQVDSRDPVMLDQVAPLVLAVDLAMEGRGAHALGCRLLRGPTRQSEGAEPASPARCRLGDECAGLSACFHCQRRHESCLSFTTRC